MNAAGRTPGPGAYNSGDQKSKGPAYVMGVQTKSNLTQRNPGPGAYSTSDLMGDKGKGHSFGGKTHFSQTGKQFPGPGSYNINSTIPVNKSGKSFGKQKRVYSIDRNSPGPAQYLTSTNYTKTSAPKFGFGTDNKNTNKKYKVTSPGPGAYNHKTQGRNAPRGLLIPRRPESAPSKGRGTPGPGQYTTNLYTKKNAPKYGMAGGVARNSARNQRVKSPGPNNYNPNGGQILQKNPTWKIGTEKRRPISARNGTPGPGNYTITSCKSGPAYGITGKRKQHKRTNTPGPGQYIPHSDSIKTSGPRCKIGTESRRGEMGKKKPVPGPGQYDNPKTKLIKAAPSFGFGTGNRENTYKKGLPGPGHYHIPCKVADVPRYQNTKQKEEFRFI
ncbi:unnamed protein product [Moneuplotes crassus]|uniref:Uncharacterized protein n=1 Tax=Euplotes crassus TaxID=5936 RepID=A0AAD1UDY9_EUPCR|nr:unnamed protein product [Moneuplotes crassus]